MTSYPMSQAKNKHDLLCVRGDEVFSTSSELFRRVLHYVDNDDTKAKVEKMNFVYSYKDGHRPLSRSVLVLGYANRSLSAVRKIVDVDTDEMAVCDGLHSYTIAVQLADEKKRYDRMEKRHQINSVGFAKFITNLRDSRRVAILAKDKYGRFGILVPFEQIQKKLDTSTSDGSDKKNYEANDFAAQIYIGDTKEIMEFLAVSPGDGNNNGNNLNNSVNNSGTNGDWKPTSPPPPIDGWKPTSPIHQEKIGNSWDNNHDDDGPTFKPDDGYDDGPMFKPDNGDDDMPWDATKENNGDNVDGGGDMPWNTTTESVGNSGGDMPWDANPNNDTSTGDIDDTTSMPWDNNTFGGGENLSSDPPLPFATNTTEDTSMDNGGSSSNKRSIDDMNHHDNNDDDEDDNKIDEGSNFHSNAGAAAADAFYSGLTRKQGTQDQSWLFHMRKFNNWVKATHISELNPKIMSVDSRTGKKTALPEQELRVLDLACGKGGDLTKWILHKRGMKSYVGIDVARGSITDAAIRARQLRKKNKLAKAVFSCADLGSDVPGRKRYPRSQRLQKLLTWSLEDEADYESGDPEFKMERGGGISETDKFDIVSIQFAIHYMMQTGKRARRFFHTVSQLLDIGGILAFTTMDARVIIDHMMNLGLNFHFEDDKEPDFKEVIVKTGGGACQLKFDRDVVKKILQSKSDGTKGEEDLFGLEYSFTLVEGQDHAAGAGDAVNLPEWLIPIPVLVALGKEAGLELEYAQNFHEFYEARSDSSEHHASHQLLANMKAPNRNGTISKDEWSISRMYMAVKFRKVQESTIIIKEDESEEYEEDIEPIVVLDPIKAKKMYPMAFMKAKRNAGDQWNSFSKEEKEERTQIELEKLAAK
mmetsp:Transcript_47/g.57  ORF Transcript_47/g.57 Transcript_47/m.57 type:complete len:868 (-) Transcript_47:313-2916(-)